jgi:3-phosphoshikimate 1-carboxyvinyltransferase
LYGETMIEIKPLEQCQGTVTLPGSKSYTHRALILSALADGESVLTHALRCEDTEHTLQGLQKFGVAIHQEGDALRVWGQRGKFECGDQTLWVGNSGTSMRFLTALAALRKGRTRIDGSERMRKRPIVDLLNGLGALGVKAHSLGGEGCPPVLIESQGLSGGNATVRCDVSSQFLSGLLMIAPYAEREVSLDVTGSLASRPYVDLTLDLMAAFGVEVKKEVYRSFLVRAGQRYVPREYRIEGDASDASYFFSAAAITRGKVRVVNFPTSSVQGDAGFLPILESMGCRILKGEGWAEVQGKDLHGIEIDMNPMPDLVPTLAVTASFARGETVIKNIGHLRFKESDRIRALAQELSTMSIRVEEGRDWLKVEGGKAHGAEIETHNDHRLAMSFAIAGLAVPGIKIKGEQCVDKSFPGFWEVLQRLY